MSSLWELDGDYTDDGPANVTGSGSAVFGIDPLVADAGQAASFNGSNQQATWPNSASWANTKASISLRFQADELVEGRQQVLFEMDDGEVIGLPAGGVSIEIRGFDLAIYTRNATGGGGSGWWLGNPSAGGNPPGTPIATLQSGVAYLLLLTVDDEASPPTKAYLWQAGRINMHSRGFGTEGQASSDRVATPAGLSIGASDDFSFSFWVWMSASQTSSSLPRWFTIGADEHVAAIVDPGVGVRLVRKAAVGDDGRTDFPVPSTGQWVHVVAIWDGTAKTWALEYDDVAQSGTVVTTLGTGTAASSQALYWGNNSNADRGLDGRLDECALWRTKLTAQNITDLGSDTLPEEIPTDLISYVTMDGHRNSDEILGGDLSISGTEQLTPAFTVASPVNTPSAPSSPIGTSGNTQALQANDSGVNVGSYKGLVDTFFSGVVDQVAIWSGAASTGDFGSAPLEVPTTIVRPGPDFPAGPGGSPTGPGIFIPTFSYQTITDAVPSTNYVWWDPTNGDDANDGLTKAQAKKSFNAAQNAISSGGTIVVAGGKHVVPGLVFVKSGTSGNRLKLFAEPGAEVVLYRDGDFKGALERTWTWTLVDAGLGIWQSPNLGIPDGETIVNTSSDGDSGNVTNGLWGFMRCPNGAHGRPHLMRMMWYDLNGNHEPGAFHNPATGGNADNPIRGGGYGGPGFYLPGDGRVQVRMQKVSSAYSGADWPTDGRMGTLIDTATGLWQEPITEDPNDYEFQITRFDEGGNFGLDGPITFNLNGQSWWHIKGINAALMNEAVRLEDGSGNNWFDKCTWYPQGCGVDFRGDTQNNTFTRCRILSADSRSISWQEHKGTGGYWFQHVRNVAMRGQQTNTLQGAGSLFEHCTFFGWFDMALGLMSMDGRVTIDHCAIMNTVDDGFMQDRTDEPAGFDLAYTYVAGGPVWSGNSNRVAGSRDWHCHHCVFDCRIPMLWAPLGSTVARTGIMPNQMRPEHSAGSNGPQHIRKFWNCTTVWCPDTQHASKGMCIGTSLGNHDVPSGRAHEVYNSIWIRYDTIRFRVTNYADDNAAARVSCDRPGAGVHRYDYNCYWRDVPDPQDAFFLDFQDSRGVNRENFSSLAAFRSSGKKVLSEAMYNSATGAFSGSDGTDGHEANGVQVDPGFVDLATRDYRPTHASVTSGALDVSTSGWPGASDTHNFKGAVDPNGDGSEIGPQNP